MMSAHDDPTYIVNGCYSDTRVAESAGSDDEAEARTYAGKMLKDPTFEGDYVVVQTRDGEIVWDSNEPEAPPPPAPTSPDTLLRVASMNTLHLPGATCVFVRLPPELCRPAIGGCTCEFCAAHPEIPPMWDTMAVPLKPRDGTPTSNYTWTVHMPDFAIMARDAARLARVETPKRKRAR